MADDEKDLQSGEPGENGETPEQKADKETKKYLKVMDVVKKVVGGEANLKPLKKVDSDVTASIVAELFAEEELELRAQVKTGLKDLLKKHVELEAEVAKKEKELKELQNKKRKEFRVAAEAWLQKIDQNAVNQTQYAQALETAFKNEEDKRNPQPSKPPQGE
jgi:response regulator RpfG family c-di-GMP phosphodiesterase